MQPSQSRIPPAITRCISLWLCRRTRIECSVGGAGYVNRLIRASWISLLSLLKDHVNLRASRDAYDDVLHGHHLHDLLIACVSDIVGDPHSQEIIFTER